MPDIIDRVQAHNDRDQSIALDAWRRRQPSGPGTAECIDCGEPIPAARKQARPEAIRCIACQSDFEKRRSK